MRLAELLLAASIEKKIPKKSQAVRFSQNSYHQFGKARSVRMSSLLTQEIDWRRLERNKFAPWGRGDLA